MNYPNETLKLTNGLISRIFIEFGEKQK